MSAAADAAAHLGGLGLEAVFRGVWTKVGRYGVAGRLATRRLGPEELRALESILGERVVAGRAVPLRRLDEALRRSRFGCGVDEVVAAWFGAPPETAGAAAARRAAAADAFLARAVPVWRRAGVPESVAETVLRREYQRARRQGDAAVAGLMETARAVGAVLGDLPARRGEAALLGILANGATGDPHAFDAAAVGGRLLLGALGAPPGAGAVRRQEVLAGAGIAVDGISSAVAVYGIADAGDAAATAAAAAAQVLVAPLRHVLRWVLPATAWAGRPVHVVENPPVFEALVERGLPPRGALVCTAGFPSAAAVVLLGALARAEAVVRYSGDFDGNGLQIADRVLGLGPGTWTTWRMEPADYAASLAAARGRPVRQPDERRGLEALAATGRTENAVLASTAAAILERGAVAFQESLVETLWQDVWRAHEGGP